MIEWVLIKVVDEKGDKMIFWKILMVKKVSVWTHDSSPTHFNICTFVNEI